MNNLTDEQRQRVIVYQSSLTRAIEVLKHNMKEEMIRKEHVMMLAEQLADAALDYAKEKSKE